MSYAAIDRSISLWVERHVLVLLKEFGVHEARCVFVSSVAGECFQIWIQMPVEGYVSLHAACVEGRRDGLPPKDWRVPVADIEKALEDAFDTVTGWMAPSHRYYPPDRLKLPTL